MDDQLAAFLSRVPESSLGYEDPDGPRTVFPSALELNREQEVRLVDKICNDKINLEASTGRDVTMDSGWFETLSPADLQESRAAQSFLGRREIYDNIYHLELDYRAYLYGGLFEYSNDHIPVTHRLVKQMAARANAYFFATDPWYAISPVGDEDYEASKAYDRWSKWHMRQARARDVFETCNLNAFIRGEGVSKTSYRHLVDYYKTWAQVAVAPNGQPLLAQDGDYIYPDDRWVVGDSGEFLLKRDLKTNLPEWADEPDDIVFEAKLVNKTATKYKGLDLSSVYYKDLLISPYAESIEDADIIIHLYDQPAIQIAHQYLEHISRTGQAEDVHRVMSLLRELAGGDFQLISGKMNPRTELGETGGGESGISELTSSSQGDPVVHLAEAYMHYDANEDGIMESIIAVVDTVTQRPIFYDYLQNVTPLGERPFHVQRVNPVDGRWHGIGMAEMFYRLNSSIDTLFNRINLAHQKEGRVDAVDPTAVIEGDNSPHLELNADVTYTLKPGKTIEDFYQSVQLVDIKTDHLQSMIDYLLQHAQNMSGVTNANDANAAGLETAKLATGVIHLERQGQELFAPNISSLSPGIESAAKQGILLCAANADEQEVYRFHNGDEWQSGIILGADIQQFHFDLELQLSRYKSEQQAVQNTHAIELLERYAAYPPEWRMAMRSIYLNQLKLYQIPNSETMLDMIDQIPPILPAGSPPPPSMPQGGGEPGAFTSPQRSMPPMGAAF